MSSPSYSLGVDDLQGWAEAARDGDPVAVAHLVRATQSDVRRLCAHLVGAAEADDLAQETFERALRALPGYRGQAPVRTWLLAIARRTCMDALRRATRRRRLVERLQRQPVDLAPSAFGQVAELDLVRSLDPKWRSAFVLTQLLGLSYSEAAEVCDVPIGTIRSRVARAREQLVAAHRAAETG